MSLLIIKAKNKKKNKIKRTKYVKEHFFILQTDDQLEWIAKYLKQVGKTPDYQNYICNHGIKKLLFSYIQ